MFVAVLVKPQICLKRVRGNGWMSIQIYLVYDTTDNDLMFGFSRYVHIYR